MWKSGGAGARVRPVRFAAQPWFRAILLYTIDMLSELAPLLMSALGFTERRVFELRTYTSYEGKLEAVKARFRDHVVRLLKKHGMESVGYWVPQDEGSKNTLIYILAHPSREAAAKNWADFAADPEWRKVAAESETNGKLVQKIEAVFMEPTEFSQIK
jgi:NIPSNAP